MILFIAYFWIQDFEVLFYVYLQFKLMQIIFSLFFFLLLRGGEYSFISLIYSSSSSL